MCKTEGKITSEYLLEVSRGTLKGIISHSSGLGKSTPEYATMVRMQDRLIVQIGNYESVSSE